MVDSSELTPSLSKKLLEVHDMSIEAIYIGNSIVHLKVPNALVKETLVPGVARGADVEIVVLKDQDTFTNHIHLLGSCWLADMLDTTHNTWLTDVINSSMLMSSWDIKDIWIAAPLERKNSKEYCMPMADPNTNKIPLMNCKTAILADQFSGVVDNTLTLCTNSLGFLMGNCKLGCAYCSIGLGYASDK